MILNAFTLCEKNRQKKYGPLTTEVIQSVKPEIIRIQNEIGDDKVYKQHEAHLNLIKSETENFFV